MLSSWTWGEGDSAQLDSKSTMCAHAGVIDRKTANRAAGRVLRTKHRFVQIVTGVCSQLQADSNGLSSVPEVTALYAPHAEKVEWKVWPESVHPRGGDLPKSRCARKEEQVKAMVCALSYLIDKIQRTNPRKLRVVEFCAGSGYVALPLACLYPELQVTVLDLKEQSIERAHRRVLLGGIGNVEVRLQDISTFNENFDIGTSLHACGSLSDLVLRKCVERRAAFVICPCCIGKVLFTRSAPLSQKFTGLLHARDFKHILRAADTHHKGEDDENFEGDLDTLQSNAENTLLGDRILCKLLVEEDRRYYAIEQGYEHTLLVRMKLTASPKRDIIMGWLGDSP